MEIPGDVAHPLKVGCPAGRAALACLYSHRNVNDPGSESANVHSALHHLFAFAKGTFHQLRCGKKLRVFLFEQTAQTSTCETFLGELQYEPRNDSDHRRDCVLPWWRRLVLAARARLTRPVLKRR